MNEFYIMTRLSCRTLVKHILRFVNIIISIWFIEEALMTTLNLDICASLINFTFK